MFIFGRPGNKAAIAFRILFLHPFIQAQSKTSKGKSLVITDLGGGGSFPGSAWECIPGGWGDENHPVFGMKFPPKCVPALRGLLRYFRARHSGRSARFPSRAEIPRMRESPLKSGGVALESARGEPESRLPFESRRRGGRRRRKSPNRKLRHLDGTRTPMRRGTNACFPTIRSQNIPPCPVCENSPKPGFRLSARACPQKTANLAKAAGEIENTFLRQPRALRPE